MGSANIYLLTFVLADGEKERPTLNHFAIGSNRIRLHMVKYYILLCVIGTCTVVAINI